MSSLVMVGFLVKRSLPKVFTTYIFILLFLITVSLFQSKSISFFYFLSEMKIFSIFTLPFVMKSILSKEDHNKITLVFYKIIVFMVFCVNIYGLLFVGSFRYTGFFQHSIYISIILVLLYSYLYNEVSFIWKALTFGVVIFLGSSSGVFIFIIATLIKLRINTIIKLLTSIPLFSFAYWYIVQFRGRQLFGDKFFEIDRVRIISSVVYNASKEFNLSNYLFGWGIGRQLNNFYLLFHAVSLESIGFEKWFEAFTWRGVYSFAFHNEILRIFFDFGLIGLIVIILYIYKRVSKEMFLLLSIACLTNTIIYSTPGLFILSLMIAIFDLNKKERT
ncbi:hypothetical protein ABE107_15455 [Priestia megaterium]